jgi:long-chain acyl-CoA synthetase
MAEDEKPWLKSYKLGPYRLEATLAPYPELPLGSLLDQSAARFPTQTAILFKGRELKLHQLKRLVDRLVAALAGMGLEKGDRVCLFLPNCPEYIIAYWGVVRAGGVVVPTSILRSQEGLLYEVGQSDARLSPRGSGAGPRAAKRVRT